ncbi:MAG: hypothetical protein QXQ91_02435, partial [Nanopusillaceae archaeon]
TLHALNQTEAAQQIGRIKSSLVLFLDSLFSLRKDIKIAAFVIPVIFLLSLLFLYIYEGYSRRRL